MAKSLKPHRKIGNQPQSRLARFSIFISILLCIREKFSSFQSKKGIVFLLIIDAQSCTTCAKLTHTVLGSNLDLVFVFKIFQSAGNRKMLAPFHSSNHISLPPVMITSFSITFFCFLIAPINTSGKGKRSTGVVNLIQIGKIAGAKL